MNGQLIGFASKLTKFRRVEDKSVRYVAEENIDIIKPDMPWSLLKLAGRHFKRWDGESHSFISNIKDEYPDD